MKQSLLPRALECLCVLYNTLFILRASVRGRGVCKTRLRISGSAVCVCTCRRVLVLLHGLLRMRQRSCVHPGVTAERVEQHLYVYIIRVVKCHCVKYVVWGCFFPATTRIKCFCNKYGESQEFGKPCDFLCYA